MYDVVVARGGVQRGVRVVVRVARWCAWRSARGVVRVTYCAWRGARQRGMRENGMRCGIRLGPSVKLGHEMGKMIREETNPLEIRNGQPP